MKFHFLFAVWVWWLWVLLGMDAKNMARKSVNFCAIFPNISWKFSTSELNPRHNDWIEPIATEAFVVRAFMKSQQMRYTFLFHQIDQARSTFKIKTNSWIQ